MKRFIGAAAITAATSTVAFAGGIDRSGQFLRPLFETGGETGQYVEFSFGSVSPKAGSDIIATDPLRSYQQWGLAYKTDISDKLSFAVILDQPFGADVDYRPSLNGFALIDSNATSGILRYKFNDNFSAHAGLRFQTIGGSIATVVGGIPSVLNADSEIGVGAIVGVAYEKPEIAMRVALTYNSEIDQDLEGVETQFTPGPASSATNFTVTTPASWNLEFQTGIAQDTLLFGTVRYVEWEGFNLTTPGAGNYVNFRENTTTYSLGVGRRFNENWSGAVTLGYEEAGLRPTNTLLAPTTGVTSIGLGVTYTQGNTRVTGGVTYGVPGDQQGSLGPATVNFNDNKVIGAGIRVGFNF